jgi:hypothetical protein
MLKPIAIVTMILTGSTAFAAGEIYRWKDASGIWQYSDQPRAGAELIRGPTASSATQSAAPVAPPPAAEPPADESLPVSQEVAQQVRQEAAAAKVKACEKAKTDYNDMITKQRIYRTDEKGTRIFLTAAEIDAARLQARSARDLVCGP